MNEAMKAQSLQLRELNETMARNARAAMEREKRLEESSQQQAIQNQLWHERVVADERARHKAALELQAKQLEEQQRNNAEMRRSLSRSKALLTCLRWCWHGCVESEVVKRRGRC